MNSDILKQIFKKHYEDQYYSAHNFYVISFCLFRVSTNASQAFKDKNCKNQKGSGFNDINMGYDNFWIYSRLLSCQT
jgi:hypothetical protein